jgi:RNA:NAD 2'-phosphotransferase (TPT1/KptA family)
MAIASQEWLEVQKAAGYYGLTLFIWSSNDATEAACKKDLKYRSSTLPLPKWNTSLVESPYFTNAVQFRDILLQSSHMVVLIGPGNKDIWKLGPEWEEASVKLCHALADPEINQHSGEALFSCIETVDGWHAKSTDENLMLYGRHCWSACKVQLLAFELRWCFKHCFYGMSLDDYAGDPKLRREIQRDRQTTFRFRVEVSGRELERMTTNIGAIDQIHRLHPELKVKQEPGEGQPSAPTPVAQKWKPTLGLEGTWSENVVNEGLSTTAPSTMANQAKSIDMPGSSSTVSGTGGLEAKIESTRPFMGGSSASTPREVAKVDSKPVVTPSKGEGQPSAGADQMAEAVEPDDRDFHDLRECSAWANDVEETQIPVPDEAWYSEGEPEEPDWTNIEFVEWNPLFNKGFSRFLMHLTRHDQTAPFREDGALSFEYMKHKCKKGCKVGFQEELLANMVPERGSVRYQVQFEDNGSISRIRAIQGHTVPWVDASRLGHTVITSGTTPGDDKRGHGADHPAARTIIHGTKGHFKMSIMRKGLQPGGLRYPGSRGARKLNYFGELPLPVFITIDSGSAKQSGLRQHVDTMFLFDLDSIVTSGIEVLQTANGSIVTKEPIV